MVAKTAVVTPDDDESVLGEVEAVTLVEDAADLGVGGAGGGVVAVDEMALELVADRFRCCRDHASDESQQDG